MTCRRILVTGAGGFVGRPAVAALQVAGFDVRALGRSNPRIPGVGFHRADLLDPVSTARAVQDAGASHLLHLAWNVAPGFWRASGNLDWVSASLLLYRAFVAAGGRHVVGAGSCAEYDWAAPLLDERCTPCRPATLYGTSKGALHSLLAAAASTDGVRLAWARIFFMYGPGEPARKLVSDLTRHLLQGEPALYGNPSLSRDFLHVADVGAALAALASGEVGGPVNIGSGRAVAVGDIAARLGRLTGRADLLRPHARATPADEPSCLVAGVGRLANEVGFRPRHALDEGLADTVGGWRTALGCVWPPTTAGRRRTRGRPARAGRPERGMASA